MEEKEMWMNKLKEKLADYSEPTPPFGWEQLEKVLLPPVEKKIYPYRRWTMAAAAVILLAIISSVSLFFLGTPAADDIRHTKTPTIAFTPDALPGVSQPDTKGTNVASVFHPVSKDRLAKTERTYSGSKDKATDRETESVQAEKEDEPSIVINGQEQLSGEDAEKKDDSETKISVSDPPIGASDKTSTQQHSRTTTRRPSGKDKLNLPMGKKISKKNDWSMGLSVGNSGGASAVIGVGSSPYMARVSMSAVSNGLMQQIPNDQTLVFEQGVPYLLKSNKVVDMKHHQPISFGLSVRKSLGHGFSLETGLTYTLLSSDAKLVDSDQNVSQKLHYLGIPLRANWNFLEKKLFTLYVTGGGMMEKCVYGKLGSEKENVKPLQFSVTGGVGMQVNATKRIGVYVEPGVSYFFDDGSSVQTIRKENPFNFNIQAGIRFTY